MADKITQEQYQELQDVICENRPSDIVRTFEELTGIVVKPYTAYQFFDAAGNFLGDDNDYTIREILQAAEIEVEE